ncbi:MAG: hypothetical protein RL154_1008 [Pseudomonadota bacterium]
MRAKGNAAETIACTFLQDSGYDIVGQNFYSRFGEIDIIAQKNSVLHFIEVKSGKNFEPILNITPKKIEKIIKTVDYYLETKQSNLPYVIDAIIIKNGAIDMVENLTI